MRSPLPALSSVTWSIFRYFSSTFSSGSDTSVILGSWWLLPALISNTRIAHDLIMHGKFVNVHAGHDRVKVHERAEGGDVKCQDSVYGVVGIIEDPLGKPGDSARFGALRDADAEDIAAQHLHVTAFDGVVVVTVVIKCCVLKIR